MESAPLYTPRPPRDRPPFRCGSRTDLTTVRLCAGRRKATPRRSSHMRDLSRPPAAPAASAARPSWAKYDLPTRVHRPHSCNQKVDRSRGLSGYTVESTSGLPRPCVRAETSVRTPARVTRRATTREHASAPRTAVPAALTAGGRCWPTLRDPPGARCARQTAACARGARDASSRATGTWSPRRIPAATAVGSLDAPRR